MTDPTPSVLDLETALLELQVKYSESEKELREARRTIKNLDVKISGLEHCNRTLRAGLAVYLPGGFWETVIPNTNADQDRGAHAEYVLRLTAGPNDPASA